MTNEAMELHSRSFIDWRNDCRLSGLRLDRLDLLCLDIFDTLLLRRCGSPEQVFARVAERARQTGHLPAEIPDDAFIDLRQEAERVARRQVGHKTTLTDIYKAFNLFDSNAAAIQASELEVEIDVLFPNPFLLSLVHEARARSLPIILVSDMYLSGKTLEQLLLLNGFSRGKDYDDLYVSCDYGASKAGGALFRHILENHPCSLKPDRILHIGDDPVTDLAGGQTAGLSTIHYQLPASLLEQFRLEALVSDLPQGPLAAVRGLVACSLPPDDPQDFWRRYGATILGPIVVHFATGIVRLSQSLATDRVIPLLREGDLIGKIVALEAKRLDVKLEIIPLSVSRSALYLPSLTCFDEEDFRKLSTEVLLTLGDIRSLFDLQIIPDSLTPYLNLSLVDLLGKETGPEAKVFQDFRNFLLSPEIQAHIRHKAAQARAALIDYVTTTLGKPGPVLLVDIGARGTMFERLQNIPEISQKYDLHGSLFYATREALHRALRGVRIHSHMPLTALALDQAQLIYRSPQFLEVLLNGEIETTIGYQRDANGRVSPLHQANQISEGQKAALAACREGILSYQKYWAELAGNGTWDQEVFPDRLLAILHRSIHLPTPVEARQLGSLEYDVNNGSATRTFLCTDQARTTMSGLCAGTAPDLWLTIALRTRPLDVPWPQGTLTELYPGHIEHLLTGARTSFDHRTICRQLIQMVEKANEQQFILCAAGGMGGMGPTFLAMAREAGLVCAAYADLLIKGDGAGGDLEIPMEMVARHSCRNVVVVSTGYGKAIISTLHDGAIKDGRPVQCWWYDGVRFRFDHLNPITSAM